MIIQVENKTKPKYIGKISHSDSSEALSGINVDKYSSNYPTSMSFNEDGKAHRIFTSNGLYFTQIRK